MYCKVKKCRYPHSHVTLGHRCGICKCYGHGQIECNNNVKKKQLKHITKDDKLPQNKYCTITDCKFKHLHTTRAHHCNRCGQNHSIKTCPLVVGIKPNNDYIVECPLCRTNNIIKLTQKQIYGCDNICCICKINKVTVFFPECGHVCVCFDCFKKIDKSVYVGNDYIKNEADIPLNIITRVKKIFKGHKCKIHTQTYGGMGCTWYIRRDFEDGELIGFFLHSDNQGQYGVNHIPSAEKFVEGYEYKSDFVI